MSKAFFWKLFYSRWKHQHSQDDVSGYTLLLPVPGDLPFFLQMAVQVCARQDLTHLVETLVIPDNFNAEIYDVFLECQQRWPEMNLRLVKLDAFDSWIVKNMNNPGHNHWLQLIRGIDQSHTSHILLHDADLFVSDDHFFRSHYEKCEEHNFSCYGVSKAWDDWFKEHEITHLVSTWEMMFTKEWVLQFAPWQLHGQDFIVEKERHTCDTTYFAQYQTPSNRVGINPCDKDWVHFNYVISTYRWFQKASGPFEDSEFRLLLIRMLHDIFGAGTNCIIPTVDQLALGLTFKDARVTYLLRETQEHYLEFRSKLQKLLQTNLLNDSQREKMYAMISPFDDSLA